MKLVNDKVEKMLEAKKALRIGAGLSIAVLTLMATFGMIVPFDEAYADKIILHIKSTGYFVEMSSSTGAELAMNVTPNENTVKSVTDTLTVKTNVKKGYNVYLSSEGTDNNLNMENAPSGVSADKTKIKPLPSNNIATSAFTVNRWGYSVNNGSNWSPVPAKGQEVSIKSETAPTSAAGTTFDVKYGTKVDGNLVAGVYKNTVLYTVVADGSSTTLKGSTSPSHIKTGDTITVAVPLYANYNVSGGEVQVSVGGKPCTDLQVTGQDKNKMTMTCKAPEHTEQTQDKDVKVYLPKNGQLPVEAGAVRYDRP